MKTLAGKLAFIIIGSTILYGCNTMEPPEPREASESENRIEDNAKIELTEEKMLPRKMRFSAEASDMSGAPMAFASPLNRYNPDFNTESYDYIAENGFKSPMDSPLSTFSADVDTASYSNVRRFLTSGTLPPPDAVRIEEMINYFNYEHTPPDGDTPFAIKTELSYAPWKSDHYLLRIALKAKDIQEKDIPARNLVFLIDVSGSMSSPDKLPLLKKGFRMLVERLNEKDRVAIVVYAGASGLVLPPTPGNHNKDIIDSLDSLESGGSTNGGEGIELAYSMAKRSYIKNGINRVILATDGDFNIGTTGRGDLRRLIEEKRKQGIELTVLGFGTGNLKDSMMESLADHGNGNYAYIDSIHEARKVLVKESGSTLVTVAKNVKFQVEFNPARVAAYRLIGYENRKLADEDFNDDKKDAGEMGAGHTVTVLYEIIPSETGWNSNIDPLKYRKQPNQKNINTHELLTLKVRYVNPHETASRLIERTVMAEPVKIQDTHDDFRFSAAVAGLGMILRDSPHKGKSDYNMVIDLAKNSVGTDPNGYRSEFVSLVHRARELQSIEN